MSQIFPGENLELAIRRSGISISEIAKRMNVNRRTVYNWFQQPSLRQDIVREISYIIGQDLTKDFPGLYNEQGNAAKRNEPKKFHDKEIEQSASPAYWMLKYIELLEKHNQVLSATKSIPADIEAA